MGPQTFWMPRNLVVVEALRVFKQKAQERGTETNANYELVMKDHTSHFSPPKVLQSQKRSRRRAMYKPCDNKIRDFIYRITEMI